MKIFINIHRVPYATFYYKVLRYMRRFATRAEIIHYLNQVDGFDD